MDREGGYKERMRKFFLHFLSVSSSFPHSLFISSQPGCKAATIRVALDYVLYQNHVVHLFSWLHHQHHRYRHSGRHFHVIVVVKQFTLQDKNGRFYSCQDNRSSGREQNYHSALATKVSLVWPPSVPSSFSTRGIISDIGRRRHANFPSRGFFSRTFFLRWASLQKWSS